LRSARVEGNEDPPGHDKILAKILASDRMRVSCKES
jgi:hypothetical protein